MWFNLILLWTVSTSTATLSLENNQGKSIHRLIGGHLRAHTENEPPSKVGTDLLIASATGDTVLPSKPAEDERKTLSQQVADGKYGLIHKELFSTPSSHHKRPAGILSYHSNDEVPGDNLQTLGGLTKHDIWLAENHLLVLRGGSYPNHNNHNNNDNSWPAIDDYKAATRQVKIPAHPKVPPPFPVRLRDGGPLQILGTNSSRTLEGAQQQNQHSPSSPWTGHDGSWSQTGEKTRQSVPIQPGSGGGLTKTSPFTVKDTNQADIVAGKIANTISATNEQHNAIKEEDKPQNNSDSTTVAPFFISLPPGVAYLPVPPAQGEEIDEDDPSIYYPPPYSFYYAKDNTSLVAPGPLVPGIVLPPPPDFFGPLEEDENIKSRTTTTTPTTQIRPTTLPVTPTSVINKKMAQKQRITTSTTATSTTSTTTSTTTTPKPIVVTSRTRNKYVKTSLNKKQQAVTILKPVPPVLQPIYATYENEITSNKMPNSNNQFRDSYRLNVPEKASKITISTTEVPLKLFYNNIDEEEEYSFTPRRIPERYRQRGTTQIKTKLQSAPPPPPPLPARYYYYEENKEPIRTTTSQNEYVKDGGYDERPQYIYVERPYSTPPQRYRFVETPAKHNRDSFNVHISRLQKHIKQYYTTTLRPQFYQHQQQQQQLQKQPKPVYQFSFEANNYRPKYQHQNNHQQQQQQQQFESDKFRPLPRYSVQIQQAIEIVPPPSQQQQLEQQIQQHHRQNEQLPAVPRPSGRYQNTPRSLFYDEAIEMIRSTENPAASKYYSTTVRPNYSKKPYSYLDQNYYNQRGTQNSDYDESAAGENTEYFRGFGKKLVTPRSRVRSKGSGSTSTTTVAPSQFAFKPRRPTKPIVQHSLAGDTNVNYLQRPQKQLNPLAEYYQPLTPVKQQQQQQQRHENKEGSSSFISYELPGDNGAHFYFLTPQLAQRTDQGSGYYYEQGRGGSG